jgi:hypothetical protein
VDRILTPSKILEHMASKSRKNAELKEFLKDCMAQTFKDLEDLCSDESNEFLKQMTARNRHLFNSAIETDYEKKDTSMLFQMEAAGIDSRDPTFAKSKSKWFGLRLLDKSNISSCFVAIQNG